MSRGVARLGDKTFGTCSAHTTPITVGGIIITASPTVTANNRAAARLGDLVQADCGHISRIITSSSSVDSNQRGIARLGDKVGAGPYDATIITASTDAS